MSRVISTHQANVGEAPISQTKSTGLLRRFTVWLLAVMAASLPLYVVRWHYGPLPTTLLETLALITIAAYVGTLWTEKRFPARTPYDILIALWLVAGLLGVLAAPSLRASAGIYRAYFIEAAAVYYVALDVLRTREDLRRLFLLSAAAAIIYATGQIVSFAWVATHGHLQLGDAPAFLNTSPNDDAMYLEPLIAFAVGFVFFPWNSRTRLVASAVLAFALVAMMLTLSRGGYLAVAVMALVLVPYLPGRRLRVWVLAGLAAAALLVLEVPLINQRIMTAGASALLRNSIYGQAIEMLSQRPLLGAGIDGFPIRVAPYRPGTQSIELYPHNLWLTTWSEVGLLGVTVLTVIIFMLLWRGLRALPLANEVYRPIVWGTVGSMVMILVHGLFDSPYWKNDLSMEFWLVAALQVVAIRAIRGRASGADRPPGP